MTAGVVLKVNKIPFEDGLHLVQYLKGNGFAVIDINHHRASQIRSSIEKAVGKRNPKILAFVDAIDEIHEDDVEIAGVIYPVLDVVDTDEVKTLSLIQEVLGIVATG